MHRYSPLHPPPVADLHGLEDTAPASTSSAPTASAAAPTTRQPRWVTENLAVARGVWRYATDTSAPPATSTLFTLDFPRSRCGWEGAPRVQQTLSLASLHDKNGKEATSLELLLIPCPARSDGGLSSLLDLILPHRVRHIVTLGTMPERLFPDTSLLVAAQSTIRHQSEPVKVTSRPLDDLGTGKVCTIRLVPMAGGVPREAPLPAPRPAPREPPREPPGETFEGTLGGTLEEWPPTPVRPHVPGDALSHGPGGPGSWTLTRLHVDVPTPGLLDPSALRTVSQWLDSTTVPGSSVAVLAMETPGERGAAGEDLNLMTMGGQLALALALRKNAAPWLRDHPHLTARHNPAAMMLGGFARDLYALHPRLLGDVSHLSAQLEMDRSRRDTSFSAKGRWPFPHFSKTVNDLRRGAVATEDTKGIRLSSWQPLRDGDPLAAQAGTKEAGTKEAARGDGTLSGASAARPWGAASWRSEMSDTDTSSTSDPDPDPDSDSDANSTATTSSGASRA